MNRPWFHIAAAAMLWALTFSTAWSAFLPDDEILAILKARVDTFRQGTGIVVGLVDSTGSRFVSYGKTHAGGDVPVDERTIFEIGSITKVFTSILLTDMARKGDLALRDPVQRFLPPDVTLPAHGGRPITLLDLATHRSGLARMPDNFGVLSSSEKNVYPIERMYAYLSSCTLVADVGERFLYSNLGYGLLGQALARHAGTDFESILVKRVCDPLGLPDTRFHLSPDQQARAAGGHDWNLSPVPPLGFDAMMAAGTLRSSAQDLVRFLAANIGLVDSPLWATLQYAHVDREDAIGKSVDIGLGWLTATGGSRELILHNGATFGNMAFSAFDKERRRGVVVLANARGYYDDIGLHLMNPKAKLFRFEDPPKKPVAKDIPIEKLEPLTGEYAILANVLLIIRERDGKLYGNYNEGIEAEMKAASETELFFDLAPFVFEFEKDRDGKVIEVVSRAYGRTNRGKKLEDYRSPAKRTRVDEDLTRYVGRYRVEDDLTIEVAESNGALVVSADGQLPMRLMRTSAGFYAYEARAELVFEETGGTVTGVTIHQEGTHTGSRIDPGSEAP